MNQKKQIVMRAIYLILLASAGIGHAFTYKVHNATPFSISVLPDIDGISDSSYGASLTNIQPGETKSFNGTAANLLRRVNATMNETWRGATAFGNILAAVTDTQRIPGRGTSVRARGYDASAWGVTGNQEFVVAGPLYNHAKSIEREGIAGLQEPYYVVTRLID